MKIPVRGPLVAIGGAEDRSDSASILGRVIACSGMEAPAVGMITTASGIPGEVFESYQATFEALGASDVHDIRVRDRTDAADEAFIEMIADSHVIFMSGGDQMRLTNVLGGTPVLQAMRSRHAEGAVVAGTSAGAACQSRTMVYGGRANDSLRKGEVKMTTGFGFVEDVIIDTHFLERGRFTRLMEVGATNPEYLGVGLGEDAGVIFEKNLMRVIGPGHVILVDSSEIAGSNVFDLHEGEAVAVQNVIMHALTDGYGYSPADRRVLSPENLQAYLSEQKNADT